MAKNKRLGGLSNIHVAPVNTDGTFGTPVPITGAKQVDISLAYDTVQFYADNAMDVNNYVFTGGTGKLTVSGLTMSEYATVFGSANANGGVLVKSNDPLPELAVLFERAKVDGSGKVLYVVYSTKFSPSSIAGQTTEAKVNEETVELDFSVNALVDQSVYYMLDTTETGADPLAISNWYTSVQKPA